MNKPAGETARAVGGPNRLKARRILYRGLGETLDCPRNSKIIRSASPSLTRAEGEKWRDETMSSLASSALGLPPSSYDALLVVSFGGPEGPDDVLPFLENVVRGKEVPRQRLLEVASHYELFDGQSPINSQNRALLAALVAELNAHGPPLPVYWGNRNWHPLLVDTIRQMADDGVQHALALVTSAFGSYSGCRQYLEDIERARQELGPDAPHVDKLRLFYNHPGFVESMADRVVAALGQIPPERRAAARLIYTAHSIPTAMAERCPYERQLRESCRLVTERINLLAASPDGATSGWDLVFQSRSGPPEQPWLEPDIGDHLHRVHASGDLRDVVVVPLGFLAENLEVVYDLDIEIRELCDELGINMVRAAVVGSHPRLVRMIRELVLERLDPTAPRLALGADGHWPDECPADCCRQP
jgi:protoporphyrin/coproporphyrin ferrochelatase